MKKKKRDGTGENGQTKDGKAQAYAASELEGVALSASLEQNIALFQDLFTNVDIMCSRSFENAKNQDLKFCIFFSDGVCDMKAINDFLIKPLMLSEDLTGGADLLDQIKSHAAMLNEVAESVDVQEIVSKITYGDTLLLVEGQDTALLFNTISYPLRGIAEPEGEKILVGPREGFTEGIMMNLSMLRRRLRTHQLKLRFTSIGKQTNTTVCIAYMDNIVNHDILKEVYRRLEQIDIDGILDTNYITEFIAEKSAYGFNTVGTTERPDTVAAKLLEGRIAIIADGTPVVLTVPYLFIENFQSNEDYYIGPIYDSYGRIIRMISFVLTVLTPAVYIAIVAYHHQILPTSLMLSFGLSRNDVPFPAALECFLMLFVFDILREAGVRMPSHVGQTLSIVGALVIGQSAVEAQLVAAPMIIVVALAGITVLIVPRLTTAGLVMRYLTLTLASILGLVGCMAAVSVCVIHLLSLHTMGIPYVLPSGRLRLTEVKDSFIRVPWPKMITRIRPLSYNRVRQNPPKK